MSGLSVSLCVSDGMCVVRCTLRAGGCLCGPGTESGLVSCACVRCFLVVAHVGCTGGLDGMWPVRCFPVSGSRFCLRDSSVNGATPKGFGAIIGGQRIVRQSFFFLSLSTLYLRIVCRGQRIIQEAGFISLRSSSYCCCAFRSFRVSGWETWW